MEVLKKENSPEYDELKICTTWEDRQFFNDWVESRKFQRAHGKNSEGNSEDNPVLHSELTTFEVVFQHKPAK